MILVLFTCCSERKDTNRGNYAQHFLLSFLDVQGPSMNTSVWLFVEFQMWMKNSWFNFLRLQNWNSKSQNLYSELSSATLDLSLFRRELWMLRKKYLGTLRGKGGTKYFKTAKVRETLHIKVNFNKFLWFLHSNFPPFRLLWHFLHKLFCWCPIYNQTAEEHSTTSPQLAYKCRYVIYKEVHRITGCQGLVRRDLWKMSSPTHLPEQDRRI